MRPLFHPQVEDIRVEAILHALSDPARAALFTQIAATDCAQTCTAAAGGACQAIPKSTLSQHFKVLREAGLIRSERQGVEMRNTSRCREVNDRFPGLLPAIIDAQKRQAS
ncbi:MAG TPA: helix-turn-helix domain-containing protein [Caulobacteraceae bacterium]|jgi:DNA-binding transcriptional ArsR family regulator